MNNEPNLLRRIRFLTLLFIVGLVLSGATAIPLSSELDWLTKVTGAEQLVNVPGSSAPPTWALWLMKIQSALQDLTATHPFLFYGTDWLAFGHFMVALAFISALRDPIRNLWLFDSGLLACAFVIPYALIFGAVRGIPLWWRLIDCPFGVFGAVPVWFCRYWARSLELGATKTVGHLAPSMPHSFTPPP